MSIRTFCLLLLSVLQGFSSVALAADHVLLNATFNNEIVGVPPSLGGAAAGEPISINCGGTETDNNCVSIATTPFSTPNLQIHDTDTYYGQFAAFGFLNDEEVTTGTVQIKAQVLFTGAGQPEIGLREQGSYAETFLDLYSADDSTYLAAYTGTAFHGDIGQFSANTIVPLEIDASADQKLISIYLNGVALLDQATIDLTTARGIGTILIGVTNTPETVDDVMRVDNLRAIACTSTTFADCLFVDSFDH